MLFLNNDYAKNKTENANLKVNKKTEEIPISDESSNMRLFIWKSAVKIATKNIILGVGTGDIKDALMIEYVKNDNSTAKINKFNVHNQFLETQLGQGIFGLFTLIMLFFIAFMHAYREKKGILFLFLIIIGVNFLFESMLNTQAGVMFFSFFYCFLIFIKRNSLVKEI